MQRRVEVTVTKEKITYNFTYFCNNEVQKDCAVSYEQLECEDQDHADKLPDYHFEPYGDRCECGLLTPCGDNPTCSLDSQNTYCYWQTGQTGYCAGEKLITAEYVEIATSFQNDYFTGEVYATKYTNQLLSVTGQTIALNMGCGIGDLDVKIANLPPPKPPPPKNVPRLKNQVYHFALRLFCN